MRKILTIALISLALVSCQKPEIAGTANIGAQKSNCVGGGCASSARVQIEMEIKADGTWISSKEELQKKNPLDDKASSTSQSIWGDFFQDLASFWNPSSVVEKPLITSDSTPEDPTPRPLTDSESQTTPNVPTFNENDLGSTDPQPEANRGKGLRGSELDKMVNNIGRHLTAGFDELNGKNNKRRQEAKEAKNKIAEASALRDKVETMVDDMNTGSATIQSIVQDVLDPKKFTPTGDLKGITKDLALEHNGTVNAMVDDTTDIETEVDVPKEQPQYNTPELRSIENARAYQTYVQRKVDGMTGPDQAQRQELIKFASNGLTVAEASFREGKIAEGEIARDLAITGLDLALSLTPGVGLAKDIYEFAAGVNALTGAKLTNFERTMAAVGILTVGYGSKLAILGKAEALIDIVRSGSKEAEVVAEAARLVSKAEEIVVSAKEIGWGVDELKTLTKSASEIKRFGPLERGILHDIPTPSGGSVADTFRSSSYFEVVSKEPVKMYRVYGGNAGELAPYWSRTKPTGPFQAQLDAAILPDFRNTAAKWVEIEVPAGTKFFDGAASPQYLQAQGSNVPVGQLLGGGNQVYIPRVERGWITSGGTF